MKRAARHAAGLLGRLDWMLAAAVVALVAYGVAFIYSAGYRGPGHPAAGLYWKQVLWFAVGCGIFLSLALYDYRRLGDQVPAIYVAGLALLVLVLFVGLKINGARRWLDLPGLLVQPSEFAKIATVIALARYLSLPDRDARRWRDLPGALAIVGVPFLLIAVEPDLGTAAVLAPVAFVMLFVAGLSWRAIGLLALLAVLALPLAWFALGDYQRDRVLVFLDPGRDPLGIGWNSIQSRIAVGAGGWDGKGWLQGTQNVLGYLPRTVAPTDFIFSVIAEETGFVGCAALIGLYAVVVARCVRAAVRARDRFGQLMAAGFGTLLFCHAFVNIAMTVGLLPITGLPLPLISYGGSFMVTAMTALGLTQSVYVRRYSTGGDNP